MASIVKRNGKYAVVYFFEDEDGEKKQKWETFSTMSEAKKRKKEIENEQSQAVFVIPSDRTVKELMADYTSIYGSKKWSLSTYQSKTQIINNYILPYLGDRKLDDITPKTIDLFYEKLLTMSPPTSKFHKPRSETISARQIQEVHKVLHNAFNMAVKWEQMSRNPAEKAILPEYEEKKREIWDADMLFHAAELCSDDVLRLAMHLSFACSLRIGELLGLTWDCVEITQTSISNGAAHLFVNKELQRVSVKAMEKVKKNGIIYSFPAAGENMATRLVLKSPKTKSSIRKVFIPKTVAEMLVERRNTIEESKQFLGEEYTDYNLVFCYPNGTPMESTRINCMLQKLIEENDLPKVVFHSIRHSSTTYKLKLTGGDIKAVQGDTGHAQATMVTERYAHIIDDDRRKTAQQFQETFYSGENHAAQVQQTFAPLNDSELLMQLLNRPELIAQLKKLI